MSNGESNKSLVLALAGALTPALATVSAPVWSQGESTGILEEVVVVARKREESLQDTPVAVSAFSNEDMRAARINNIGDLTEHVPGLSNKDGEKGAGLTIRGVGARVRGVKTDPGVGVYVDGIFMPRSDTQLVDVVEMESIQVLRGPQGTLFGKNTAGGAILMSSRKPGEEFEGHVDVGLGDYNRREIRARVSGPLVQETLYAALTFDKRKIDGYMEDAVSGTDYGNIDRQALVGQLRYEPTDNLSLDFIALWGERTENSAPYNCINRFNPDAQFNRFASTAVKGSFAQSCEASGALVDDDKVLMDYTVPLEFTVTNKLAGLTLDWDAGAVQLRSITGYLYQDDLKRDTDSDGTQFLSLGHYSAVAEQLNANGISGSSEERSFFSQEFNLFGSLFNDHLDYTLGVYYSDEKIDDQVDGQVLEPGGWIGLPSGDDVITIAPSTAGYTASLVNLSSESAAAFGQFIYNINDYWQLTLGGRYTWEQKTIDQFNYVSSQGSLGLISGDAYRDLKNFIQPVVAADVPKLEDAASWTQFSPSATITTFLPDSWTGGFLDTGMFYFTYSEGFKAGGFSDFGLDQPVLFEPEEVQNLELGFKLEMWSHRFRLNGALYSMDYDDIQLAVTRTLGNLDTRFGITNAGQAEMNGAELEVVLMPLPGLLINLTGSYIDASYNEFIDSYENNAGELIVSDRKDEPFSYLPAQTYSWGFQYDWNLDSALIIPRVSGYFKDEIYLGQDPESAEFEDEATLDSYVVWNARLAYRPHRVEGLEISAFVDNFTDATYYGSGVVNTANIGAVIGIRGKPRHWGVDVYYSW